MRFGDITGVERLLAATLFSGLLQDSLRTKLSVNHCKKYLYLAATPFSGLL